MRHRVKTDSLGRFSSYRKATIKSIVVSILINQKIVTTKAKAKMARGAIERVITLGKKSNLASKRRAFSLLCDHKLVKTLFDQIAPLFKNRAGGYTRIIHFRNRRGDNAQLVLLELTESFKHKKAKKEIKDKKEESKPVVLDKKKQQVERQEKPTLIKEQVKEIKEPSKVKPTDLKVDKGLEEKSEAPKPPPRISVAPEEKKHKKQEAKRPKKFFGGLKRFFKKERDSL